MTMEVLPECTVADQHPSCMKPAHEPESSHPLCLGCGGPILDQYLMRVHPNMQWHASCLQCVECSSYLDEKCTCYVKDGKTYCKPDYARLFGTQCSKCGIAFGKSDFVMRASDCIYHIDCFRCTACSRQLVPGDEFALREGGLFCKEDNEILNRTQMEQEREKHLQNLHNNNNNNNNNNLKMDDFTIPSKNRNEIHSSSKIKRVKEGKTTRVRTVLNEKQLHTLRTCYGANPRPDALMKEQLVEMTGLSPRVIRVWFQNKRCKDKKRSILMKQMQQQDKNLPNRLQGVPMVAQSPVNHDGNLQPIDSYHHQTWKRMPEYNNMQHREEINHNSFQLMGSMYSSDDSVYLNEEDYMDCGQPGSVSSQFSGASASPHSSG